MARAAAWRRCRASGWCAAGWSMAGRPRQLPAVVSQCTAPTLRTPSQRPCSSLSLQDGNDLRGPIPPSWATLSGVQSVFVQPSNLQLCLPPGVEFPFRWDPAAVLQPCLFCMPAGPPLQRIASYTFFLVSLPAASATPVEGLTARPQPSCRRVPLKLSGRQQSPQSQPAAAAPPLRRHQQHDHQQQQGVAALAPKEPSLAAWLAAWRSLWLA